MIQIKPCPVADVLASKKLIAEYAAECSIPAVGEIDPQPAIYAAIETAGLLQSFMVTDDGQEIGFAIVLTPVLPHYGKKIATLESLFVTRFRRQGSSGRELMYRVEQYAREVGCSGILYSSPVGSQLEKVLEASKNYQRTNVVFYRSLS